MSRSTSAALTTASSGTLCSITACVGVPIGPKNYPAEAGPSLGRKRLRRPGDQSSPDAAHPRPGLWHIGGFFMKKAGRWPGLRVVQAADLPGRPIGMSLASLRLSTSDRDVKSILSGDGFAPVGEPNVAVWLLPARPRSPHFEFSGSWPAALSRFLRGPIHGLRCPPRLAGSARPERVTAGLCGTLNASPNVQNTLNPRPCSSSRASGGIETGGRYFLERSH